MGLRSKIYESEAGDTRCQRERETGKEGDGEREGERKEYVLLSGTNVPGVIEWHASLNSLMPRLRVFMTALLIGQKL